MDELAWDVVPRGGRVIDAESGTDAAGTFCRAMRLLTRENAPLGLSDALNKSSLHPARLQQDRAPTMRRKGRLQPGCDADIVAFDPDGITDRATYTDSTRPSAGIRHVLVNGTFVVRTGRSCPVRGRPAGARRATMSRRARATPCPPARLPPAWAKLLSSCG